MSYTLRILRKKPFDLQEWNATVEAVDDVRLCRELAQVITAPNGQAIRVPLEEGHAEVYFPAEKDWHPVFRYHKRDGCVSFRAPRGDTKQDPVWASATALAKLLDGAIVGEEGEIYDLETLAVTANGWLPHSDDDDLIELETDEEVE